MGPLCYSASNPSLLSRFGRLVEPPHVPPPPYPPPQASRRFPFVPGPIFTQGKVARMRSFFRCFQFGEWRSG
jgi:hypothetical protein